MSSIISSGDSYELTKVPFFQKIGNMAISGVIYIAVAIVGVVIGVAGATYTFEQTEIEPKIKELTKKIGDGVENIQPETVKQVAAAITDLSKTGQDVVNVVESLAEGGNAESKNAEGGNAEGGIELSDMSKKTGLPLSVNSLTAATTGAGLDKVTDLQNVGLGKVTDLQNVGLGKVTDLQNVGLGKVTDLQNVGLGKVTDLQNAGLGKVSDLQNAGLGKVSDLQNAGLGKVSNLQNAGLGKVSDLQNAGLGKVSNLQNAGLGKVSDLQNAGLGKVSNLQNAGAEQTKALEKFGSNAMEQYKLRKETMSNIKRPELNFNNQPAPAVAAAAGGGKKTKSKRTKLTKEAKVKKPRTKKCLIQKDNKMYMSFCI
jgi:hypothetical protein